MHDREMMKNLLAGALALLAVGHSSALVATPLAPTRRWVVDFADHQCIASRDYGSKDKPLLLVLKPSPTGNVMQVAIARRGTVHEVVQHPATMTLNDGDPIKVSLLSYTPSKQDRQIGLINLSTETFASVRRSTSLSISAPGKLDASFMLTGMELLMKTMDRCLADLQDVWNIGEAREARIKEAAKSKKSLGSLFDSHDYPSVALEEGQTGTVAFVLLVDESGKVVDCTVTQTSGIASLDAQSCAIIRARGKFAPAIGLDGRPIKSSLTSRIRWDLAY